MLPWGTKAASWLVYALGLLWCHRISTYMCAVLSSNITLWQHQCSPFMKLSNKNVRSTLKSTDTLYCMRHCNSDFCCWTVTLLPSDWKVIHVETGRCHKSKNGLWIIACHWYIFSLLSLTSRDTESVSLVWNRWYRSLKNIGLFSLYFIHFSTFWKWPKRATCLRRLSSHHSSTYFQRRHLSR